MREKWINKDLYEVHDGKKIWSKLKKRYLKGCVDKHGYVMINLKCVDGEIRTFYWHRVIWYFINGEIPDGYEINHIDENKQNNHISNLNLMTHKENINWGSGHERSVAKQKGKKLSEEHKEKIVAKLIGRKYSEETKRKISESLINNANISKSVVAVKDGEIVMEFASITEAYRNGFNKSAVWLCCKKKYYGEDNNFYRDYHWYFKEDWIKMQATHDRVACGKNVYLINYEINCRRILH